MLKFIIFDRFKLQSGVDFGLMCGLVTEQNDILRYDIALIKSRPTKFLSIELDVIDWYPSVDLKHGAFSPPKSVRLNSNGIFKGTTTCLLTRCAEMHLYQPDYFVFAKKLGVSSDSEGWELQLSDAVEAVSFSEAELLLSSKEAGKQRGEKRRVPTKPAGFSPPRAKKVSERLDGEDRVIGLSSQLSAFNNAFGSQIRTPSDILHPSKTIAEENSQVDLGENPAEHGITALGEIFADYEDVDGSFKLGDASDDEHARNRFGDIDTEDVLRKMDERLDDTRYWAFVDKTTGRIFTRWRGQELESHQKSRRSR